MLSGRKPFGPLGSTALHFGPMNHLLFTLGDAAGSAPWYALRLSDAVMILAVLAAPWIAVHVQRRLDATAERRSRRNAIFRTLMATRAARVSADHVAALNMIDLEFYGAVRSGQRSQTPEDRAVTDAWRIYLDSLDYGSGDDAALAARIEKSEDKFVDLLFAMSRALGYDFDRVLLHKGVYTPKAHGLAWQQDIDIRSGLARLLRGEGALGVTAIVPDEALKEQQRIQKLLAECLSGKRALSVKVADAPGDSGSSEK